MIQHTKHSIAEAKAVKTRQELTAEANNTNSAVVETWLSTMTTQEALMEVAMLVYEQEAKIEALEAEIAALKGE